MNQLEGLKQYTTVVADTGDIEAIANFSRRTRRRIRRCFSRRRRCRSTRTSSMRPSPSPKKAADQAEQAVEFMDELFVRFGCEILKIIPGPRLDRGRRRPQLRHRRRRSRRPTS